MEKVITINLGGISYQLEEAGYHVLQKYLDDARAALESNPDRDEIMSDLERAVGEKCAKFLNSNKNVITAGEVATIIKEMGPVGAPETEESKSGAESQSDSALGEKDAPKRLYRIPDGEWISGVCTGIAAYFNIDVTLVRLLFVVGTILTHGIGILIYIIMMIVVPVARTGDERAEARGQGPVTAQELIDRARESYEQFANSAEWRNWKRDWRQNMRDWKKDLKTKHTDHVRKNWGGYNYNYDYSKYADYAKNYGRYVYRPSWQYSPFWEFVHMIFGIFWLLFWGFVIWWLYGHVAIVHQFIDLLPMWANNIWHTVSSWWVAHV